MHSECRSTRVLLMYLVEYVWHIGRAVCKCLGSVGASYLTCCMQSSMHCCLEACPYLDRDLLCIINMLGCVVVVLVSVLTGILFTVVKLLTTPSFPHPGHLASVRLPASVLLPGKSSGIRYSSYQVTRFCVLLLCTHCYTILVAGLHTVLQCLQCCAIPGCLVSCIPAGCYCHSLHGCARCDATTYSCQRLYRQVCTCFVLCCHAKGSVACTLGCYSFSSFAVVCRCCCFLVVRSSCCEEIVGVTFSSEERVGRLRPGKLFPPKLCVV